VEEGLENTAAYIACESRGDWWKVGKALGDVTPEGKKAVSSWWCSVCVGRHDNGGYEEIRKIKGV